MFYIFPYLSLFAVFVGQGLSLNAEMANLAGWLQNPRVYFPSAGVTGIHCPAQLFTSSGDLNSGSHTFKPSPWLSGRESPARSEGPGY